LQAFGAAPLILSRIGDDGPGRRAIKTMQAWGMTTEGVQIDRDHPTGMVNITLTGIEPSYDIVEHQAYDYIDRRQLPALDEHSILYHGSLACRGEDSRTALDYLSSRQALPRFVDINLRKPHYNPTEILELIQGATWLKLNEAEFLEVFASTPDSAQAIAARMDDLDLNTLVITRGEHGAEVITSNGSRCTVKPARPTNVKDSVGAGDAFSSVLLLGQVNGWDLEPTLCRAHDFAEAILGIRGATLNDMDFYRSFKLSWGLKGN
jgi:fructokinase